MKIILIGKQGSGKTTWANRIACAMVKEGIQVQVSKGSKVLVCDPGVEVEIQIFTESKK